jgi:transcriptional regulator GlxA family with amidase domain
MLGIRGPARELYCGGHGVWTPAGVTAGIDLLRHMARIDWGATAPEMIARWMVTPVFRPGSQAQYADTATPTHTTPTVSVADLAAACALTPRTFHRWLADRVGRSPISWLNDLRVREATGCWSRAICPSARWLTLWAVRPNLLRKHVTARL